MPREHPKPQPFEPDELERSLERHLAWGAVFMVVLIGSFFVYLAREPSLRHDAATAQASDYTRLGGQLFQQNCASCHGKRAVGGSAPTLDAKEFLGDTTDLQIRSLIANGIPGTDMSAWGIDAGGTFTDQQITSLVTYLRSLEAKAPSVPNWRQGHSKS